VFNSAERAIGELLTGQNGRDAGQSDTRFAFGASVYGHMDVVVCVESPSLWGVHQAVQRIRALQIPADSRDGDSGFVLSSTETLITVEGSEAKRDRIPRRLKQDVNLILVGMDVRLGHEGGIVDAFDKIQRESVLFDGKRGAKNNDKLTRIVLDMVFGRHDIMGLFYTDRTKVSAHSVLDQIADRFPFIDKTTTYLPMRMGLQDLK
jgi:hypothetical protein